ncbi:hypothetical protein [Candidatus Magnetobacterium casense]|uniref:Secreted protein n=1 Tax=Candidatus Magnetobacterium casense TaxID=1455061 RepID=A0ABS6S282_9BACT|nr:hypothetical protein [Candidatus Magnetobacterium casensis]MBV6342944.1 hypothetical protein [Candidatus Magnetobacterium casensis]
MKTLVGKIGLLVLLLLVFFTGCLREHVSSNKLEHAAEVDEKTGHSRDRPLNKEDIGSSMF